MQECKTLFLKYPNGYLSNTDMADACVNYELNKGFQIHSSLQFSFKEHWYSKIESGLVVILDREIQDNPKAEEDTLSSKSSEPLRVVPKDKPQSVYTVGAKPDLGILLTDKAPLHFKNKEEKQP